MMMGNKGTFSAGDMAKQGMRQGPRRPTQSKTSAASLGYPTIEGLLESEDFSKLHDGYESVKKQSEEIMNAAAQSPRNKKRARQAIEAYDRGLDLLKELLEIKAQMLKG